MVESKIKLEICEKMVKYHENRGNTADAESFRAQAIAIRQQIAASDNQSPDELATAPVKKTRKRSNQKPS